MKSAKLMLITLFLTLFAQNSAQGMGSAIRSMTRMAALGFKRGVAVKMAPAFVGAACRVKSSAVAGIARVKNPLITIPLERYSRFSYDSGKRSYNSGGGSHGFNSKARMKSGPWALFSGILAALGITTQDDKVAHCDGKQDGAKEKLPLMFTKEDIDDYPEYKDRFLSYIKKNITASTQEFVETTKYFISKYKDVAEQLESLVVQNFHKVDVEILRLILNKRPGVAEQFAQRALSTPSNLHLVDIVRYPHQWTFNDAYWTYWLLPNAINENLLRDKLVDVALNDFNNMSLENINLLYRHVNDTESRKKIKKACQEAYSLPRVQDVIAWFKGNGGKRTKPDCLYERDSIVRQVTAMEE